MTLDISTREEIPSVTKKLSSSLFGRNFSHRQENCSPSEFKYDDEQTYIGHCHEEDDLFETYVNRDSRSVESVHRDVMTNDRQSFDISQNNYDGKSELEEYQAQEGKERLRRKGHDKALTFQKNHNTGHATETRCSRVAALYELGKYRIMVNRELVALNSKVDKIVDIDSIKKSQRIIDLYELGRHRIMSNREIAATNSLAVDNLATNVAALSETKASVSEIAGHRLFTQAKQRAERLDKLIQLTRETQKKLEKQQRYQPVAIDWKKKKFRESQRINDLYELGKHRVMSKREIAATNLVALDNLARSTKYSFSEIAGQRLFTQAKLSAERMTQRRQKAKETPVPQMKLETKKRCHMTSIKWGKSAIERFSMLYERGRIRVAAEKELEMKTSNKIVSINKKGDAGFASKRQLELYTMGTQRLIDKKLDETQHSDAAAKLSTKLQTKIEANVTMIKLYEMSKNWQEEGKKRRQGVIYSEDDMSLSIHQSQSLLSKGTPNATMLKLYALSEMM